MSGFSRCIAASIISAAIALSTTVAQTATVVPANEAGAHIGGYATVERAVAKLFISKSGNAFLNIGAADPNQTFTGWIPPASPVSKSPLLSRDRRKARQGYWVYREVQGQARNSDQCRRTARGRVIDYCVNRCETGSPKISRV
jgi:hypothetical protein